MGCLLVEITASSFEEAERIGRTLVEERLAACANILPPARSLYWWEGRIEEAGETPMVLKTRAELFAPLRRRVVELHSYDCPAVLALPIADAHPDYLAWLDRETTAAPTAGTPG